jgi:hypothetical protein
MIPLVAPSTERPIGPRPAGQAEGSGVTGNSSPRAEDFPGTVRVDMRMARMLSGAMRRASSMAFTLVGAAAMLGSSRRVGRG